MKTWQVTFLATPTASVETTTVEAERWHVGDDGFVYFMVDDTEASPPFTGVVAAYALSVVKAIELVK